MKIALLHCLYHSQFHFKTISLHELKLEKLHVHRDIFDLLGYVHAHVNRNKGLAALKTPQTGLSMP